MRKLAAMEIVWALQLVIGHRQSTFVALERLRDDWAYARVGARFPNLADRMIGYTDPPNIGRFEGYGRLVDLLKRHLRLTCKIEHDTAALLKELHKHAELPDRPAGLGVMNYPEMNVKYPEGLDHRVQEIDPEHGLDNSSGMTGKKRSEGKKPNVKAK